MREIVITPRAQNELNQLFEYLVYNLLPLMQFVLKSD